MFLIKRSLYDLAWKVIGTFYANDESEYHLTTKAMIFLRFVILSESQSPTKIHGAACSRNLSGIRYRLI